MSTNYPENNTKLPTLRITGYSDPFSVKHGEEIDFFVHSEQSESYEVQIVRLVHGDTNPAGPGYKEVEIDTAINGTYRGQSQPVFAGSYIYVPDDERLTLSSFSLGALIYPTTPDLGKQGIITKWSETEETGYGLFIDENSQLSLWIGNGKGEKRKISSDRPLFRKVWYSVGATFNAVTGEVGLYQIPYITSTSGGHGMRLVEPISDTEFEIQTKVTPGTPSKNDCPLLIAASTRKSKSGRNLRGGHYKDCGKNLNIPIHEANFNGRIERPILSQEALQRSEIESLVLGNQPLTNRQAQSVIGLWNFSRNIGENAASQKIVDESLNGLHGTCVNLPDRGMPGHNWSGDHMSFVAAPREYGAIHFHDDSVDDARWNKDFSLKVPKHLKSGVYAARLRINGEETPETEDYIPFVVRPSKGKPTAKIALVLPLASYLAYANENLSPDSQVAQLLTGRIPLLQSGDLLLQEKSGYGLGTYTVHSDGWGVCTSSRLRPILNMRPKYSHVLSPSAWQLNADLYITDWLESMDFEFDVFTDEDLQKEGVDLLRPYRVVLTGHHPEYNSEEMLDAYEAYQEQGGRWIYLGANGFYWCCVFHPDNSGLIEVRKGDNGTRAWTIEPGEYCNAFDGKHGGLWRVRGRNMSKLVGVTFTSFGLGASSYYRRTPDSWLPECEWMFEGISKDEPIGDFGLIGDGAAGLELDRYDLELGTPHRAFVLAHSEGHNDFYVSVSEESTFNARGYFAAGGLGDSNPYTRADIVYFKTPNDGAVFSVSSMAWAGSLSHNNYNNNVSQLTANVIRGFLKEKTLP